MTRFTSTTPLPSATRKACNRALHASGLPTLGSARTIEAWLPEHVSLGQVRATLRPVGLVVPRVRGAHAAA